MKILLINPNLTHSVTDRVLQAAQVAARLGTEILAVTGTFGPQVISSRAENALAAHGVLDLVARHAQGCDAVVLAVSLDTALWACRELLDVPVVGMTEAGLHTAALLVPRFGLLTYGQRLVPVYRELANAYGLLGRMVAFKGLDITPEQTFSDPELVSNLIRVASQELVNQGAEAIVLAGAAMAALAPTLQSAVSVPLLDGVACAVGLAETLVHQGWRKTVRGNVSAIGSRVVHGVSPELRALFARQ